MIETDPEVVASFLSDAAHVPGGFAAGVAFPATADEVASLVMAAPGVLPVGAQSSLTGGATPRGEVVLSTRALTSVVIDEDRGVVRVGAGVPLSTLQTRLAGRNLWYPPAPTYDGAFVGGVVSTNAAGAATFKYGATRAWVEGLSVVLPDGRLLSLNRGDIVARGYDLNLPTSRGHARVSVPNYRMPDVPKLSAGYFARPDMDLIDLLVGSEGTLGVIVEATLRVVRRPARLVALAECAGDAQAFQTTRLLRERARRTWRGEDILDVSAIEYMDARSLTFVADATFSGVGIGRPRAQGVLLLVQIEVTGRVDEAVEALIEVLEHAGVQPDPVVALPGDVAGATRLFALREAVPAAVNAAIGAAKQTVPDLQKTAGDFIVPFDRLAESVGLYREIFEGLGLDYAIWGHVSDGNMHPNVVPTSLAGMERARRALLELARATIAMGGSPLAEHGVGRSPLKQQLLTELYGEQGVEQMRAVKGTLDPEWKMAPGVLFPVGPGTRHQP